ncbi:MAG: NAD(P)-dependent oxidoreductase [Acidobacteria bacterium]|nr:NAD(P)-dependent oxidoreductase [Acidobacteriota bacterium]
MRVAITGAAGLFGRGLVQVFSTRHEVFPLTRAEAELTEPRQVHATLAAVRPELVVHPAGIPDLDICEAEPAKAFQVNVHGTRHVVEAARELGAGLVYISTDAVFDGKKQTPYDESDPTSPPTVYGRTKLRGEHLVRELERHWIFRVSVLFGPGKTNFVEKGLRKLAAGEEYVVAVDQVGSATYTLDAAHKIMEVVEAGRTGLFHLSNQGSCSRLELARCAAELAGLDPDKVIGKPREEMGRRAHRLAYAVMGMQALSRAGFALPRPWPEALADYIHTLPSFSLVGSAPSASARTEVPESRG